MKKNYDGWCFKWIRMEGRSEEFFCEGTFASRRDEAWRNILSSHMSSEEIIWKDRRALKMKWLKRRGGFVVKVRFIEVKT